MSPARLAMLPDGLDSIVTQLLANMLTKPPVFYYLPIVPCNLVSIKLLLLLLLIPKGPSPSVANYRQISITPVLSKVFERLVAVRLGRFMEHCGVLPTTQFAYRKGLGTCDALLCMSHTL